VTLGATKIPYIDTAWNPAAGCRRQCSYCYVRRYAHRLACKRCRDPQDIHLHEERLGDPAKARTPRVIGVCFNCDLFDPKRPHGDIASVLAACEAAPWHQYVFPTKRPERAAEWCGRRIIQDGYPRLNGHDNWWVGVTAEDQQAFDARAPVLLGKGIGHLWLSLEPLHGDIYLARDLGLKNYDWVAVGCQSSYAFGALEGDIIRAWMIDVADQCREGKVPVFVKQVPIDGKCSRDPAEWPPELRVRELAWKLREKPWPHVLRTGQT